MPYCKECGSLVKDGAKYCENCGCATDSPMDYNPPSEQKQNDQGTPAWFLVGLFFPLIGFIASIVLYKSKPVSSKYAMYGAITPIVVALILIGILVMLPSDPDGSYEYTLKEISSYEDDYYEYYPDSGMTFIEVKVTIYADSSGYYYCDDFNLMCNGERYKCDAYDEYSLWIREDDFDYFILIFEIPSSHGELYLKYVGSKDLTNDTAGRLL